MLGVARNALSAWLPIMFGKLGTKHLLVVLALLTALWWISGRFSPRAQQRTFREQLLVLDSNTVSSFTLTPAPFKHLPPLDFQRTAEGWLMRLGKDSSLADPAPIHLLLRSWSGMRVTSLAGRMADVADKYDLGDSTADRLRITAGTDVHEFLVGRHTAGEAPMTVVSVPGDEYAYAIDGILGLYADRTFGEWLPKYLVTGDPKNWQRIVFNFPTDTGYVMDRGPDGWRIDGVTADQMRVDRFLSSLARARGQSVADPTDTLSAIPQFRLIVEDTTRRAPIVVVVYVSNGKFIVRSSLNPGTVMPFGGRDEIPRMFRPRTTFLPH